MESAVLGKAFFRLNIQSVIYYSAALWL